MLSCFLQGLAGMGPTALGVGYGVGREYFLAGIYE